MRKFNAVFFSLILFTPILSFSADRKAFDGVVPELVQVINQLPENYEFTSPLQRISTLLLDSFNSAEESELFENAETYFLIELLNETLNTLTTRDLKQLQTTASFDSDTPSSEHSNSQMTEKPLPRTSGWFSVFKRPSSLKLRASAQANLTEDEKRRKGNDPISLLEKAKTKTKNFLENNYQTTHRFFVDGAKWFLRKELHELTFRSALNQRFSEEDSTSISEKIMLSLNLSGILSDGTAESAEKSEKDFLNSALRHFFSRNSDLGSFTDFARNRYMLNELRSARRFFAVSDHRRNRHLVQLDASLIQATLVLTKKADVRIGSQDSDALDDGMEHPEAGLISFNGSDDANGYFQTLKLETFTFSENDSRIQEFLDFIPDTGKARELEKSQSSRPSLLSTFTVQRFPRQGKIDSGNARAKEKEALEMLQGLIPETSLQEWLRMSSAVYQKVSTDNYLGFISISSPGETVDRRKKELRENAHLRPNELSPETEAAGEKVFAQIRARRRFSIRNTRYPMKAFSGRRLNLKHETTEDRDTTGTSDRMD